MTQNVLVITKSHEISTVNIDNKIASGNFDVFLCHNNIDKAIILESMQWVDFRRKDQDAIEQLIWGITGERKSLHNTSNS